MILIFTGNGKGKTTAALGQAMRAIGEGKRVLMVQFIKGPWKSGEDFLATGLEPNFKLVKMGRGFVGILGDTLPREEHEKAAEEALAFATSEALSGAWNMVILDEVNNAIHLGLLDAQDVLEFLDTCSRKVEHFLLTGRDARQELIDRADLVTEMRDIKHPYHKGVRGKRGLEY
ncbi:MAG: cob(I)yrinic acid a,c-diamide adenosyltransferase [Candidatus Sungbacteria bacterium]|nr:cob(I)yrinic acid a,c-diamide adenosyltransferase [Candidatus Sungbacteria bacterium]